MTRLDGAHDRRTYLRATTAAVVGAVGLTGCLGSGGDDGDGGGGGGDETGTLATQVTDDPGDIEDFESCVVTVVGYWLGPAPDGEGAAGTTDGTAETTDGTDTETAGGDPTDTRSGGTRPEDGDGEREYHELDEPAEADLVELQDGATQLLAEDELATGSHAFLQLDTDGVDATLTDGTEPTVEFPGDAPVTFNEAFEIRADTRTTFTADFTPVQRGRTGRYLIQPVPSGITVAYEAIESDDGTAAGDGTTAAGESTDADDGATDATATEA